MASEKVALILLFLVICVAVEKCSCQFFTKTQKSIPRMGRSIDERTLVLVSKLLANINGRELRDGSTEAPVKVDQQMIDGQTGYELSRDGKRRHLLNNYLINKHTTRFLMSLKESNEQDAQVGSPGSIDQRRKLKSLLATSSIVSSPTSSNSPSPSNSRVLYTRRKRTISIS